MTDAEKISMLSSRITPSRLAKLERAAAYRTNRLTVVLEDVYQPHNIAAVLRNCDAFGVQNVHIIENKYKVDISRSVDMGASKWLTVERHTSACATHVKNGLKAHGKVCDMELENTKKALLKIKNMGYTLAASTLSARGNTMDDIPADRPVALLIGTELTGLTLAAREMADFEFGLDMLGLAQSLNLSVFSALCISSVSRRMRALDDSWRLTPSQRESLLLSWLEKSVKNPPYGV